jgi:Fe-S cluster assembly iron-binding protein IscA
MLVILSDDSIPCWMFLSLPCRVGVEPLLDENERMTVMLVLTDAAAEVVKSVTEDPQSPEIAGLRITRPSTEPDGKGDLRLAPAPRPAGDDQVVEAAGARVFLDPPAAAFLDDKVLDAEVGPEGTVHFTLVMQEPPIA